MESPTPPGLCEMPDPRPDLAKWIDLLFLRPSDQSVMTVFPFLSDLRGPWQFAPTVDEALCRGSLLTYVWDAQWMFVIISPFIAGVRCATVAEWVLNEGAPPAANVEDSPRVKFGYHHYGLGKAGRLADQHRVTHALARGLGICPRELLLSLVIQQQYDDIRKVIDLCGAYWRCVCPSKSAGE